MIREMQIIHETHIRGYDTAVCTIIRQRITFIIGKLLNVVRRHRVGDFLLLLVLLGTGALDGRKFITLEKSPDKEPNIKHSQQ